MSLQIKESGWPLIVATMENATFDETVEYLKRNEAWLKRKQPYAIVLVLKGNNKVGSDIRQAHADFMKRHADEMKTHMTGLSLIVENSFIRAIVTSVLWMQPIPCPYRTFSNDVEAGTAWAMEQLQARGASV